MPAPRYRVRMQLQLFKLELRLLHRVMYITASKYPLAYQSIVSKSRTSSRGQQSSTCSTFLVVSPDVDALCAAHLLASMLKLDDVVNTVIPVSSWSDLEQLRHRLQNEDVSLFAMELGAARRYASRSMGVLANHNGPSNMCMGNGASVHRITACGRVQLLPRPWR